MNGEEVMKKFSVILIVFLLVIATVAGLAACDKKEKDSPTNNPVDVPDDSQDVEEVVISFDTGGAGTVEDVKLKKGESYTLPELTSNERNFKGWYYDKEFKSFAGASITADGNVTLYAKWTVTLSFETNGGTELEPREYYPGDMIDELLPSEKPGYVSLGWFYDSDFITRARSGDVIERNTVLYAGFSNGNNGMLRTSSAIGDVCGIPEIRISSSAILTQANLSDYVSLKDANDVDISMNFRPDGENAYILTPANRLSEGSDYFFTSLTGETFVLEVDGKQADGASDVSFSVYKDSVDDVVRKELTFINKADVYSMTESPYGYKETADAAERPMMNVLVVVSAGMQFAAGELIYIGETEGDEEYIGMIVSAETTKIQISTGEYVSVWSLNIVTPYIDELYEKYEAYGKHDLNLEGSVTALSKEQILDNLKASENLEAINAGIADSLAMTAFVENYVSTLESDAEREQFMAALASFTFNTPEVDASVSGNTLSFSITLGGSVSFSNVEIEVEFSVSNKTSLSYKYDVHSSGKKTLDAIEAHYIYVQLIFSNQFEFDISATVKLTDGDESETMSISEELKNLINASVVDADTFLDAMGVGELMDGGGLDYNRIFSANIGSLIIPLGPTPVTIGLDFSVVGELGLEAGFELGVKHTYTRDIVLSNVSDNGDVTGDIRVGSNQLANRCEIDVSLRGYAGLRVGISSRVSLSVAALNSVLSIYAEATFGPYIELAGICVYTYAKDAVTNETASSLSGGLYFELGIFLTIKGGAKVIAWDLEETLLDMKFPLYTVGEKLLPIAFEDTFGDPDNPYVFNSKMMTVDENGNLMYTTSVQQYNIRLDNDKMIYVDMTTGETTAQGVPMFEFQGYYGAYQKYEEQILTYFNWGYIGYSMELVDDPDWCTPGYENYVSLIEPTCFTVSSSYVFDVLRFKVRISYKSPYGTAFSNEISCYRYVEYRLMYGFGEENLNIPIKHKFVDGGTDPETLKLYSDAESDSIIRYLYTGTRGETVSSQTVNDGETPYNPYMRVSDLPTKDGFYLDSDDLWVKYRLKVTIGSEVVLAYGLDKMLAQENDANSTVFSCERIDDWDGTFEPAGNSEDWYDYELNLCVRYLYVLNWKPVEYEADVYVPELASDGSVSDYVKSGTIKLRYYYNPLLDWLDESEESNWRYSQFDIVDFDETIAPEYLDNGMKRTQFAANVSGMSFSDVKSGISVPRKDVGRLTDVLETEKLSYYVKYESNLVLTQVFTLAFATGVKHHYEYYYDSDYNGKADDEKVDIGLPEEFRVGYEFEVEYLPGEYYTYKIAGYSISASDSATINGKRNFSSVEELQLTCGALRSMRGCVNLLVICDRTDAVSQWHYANVSIVNVKGQKITMLTGMLRESEEHFAQSYQDLKDACTVYNVTRAYFGVGMNADTFASIEVVWPEQPELGEDGEYDIVLTLEYAFPTYTVTFAPGEYTFTDGSNESLVFSGEYVWNPGIDDCYLAPELNEYTKVENGETVLMEFIGWKNADGELLGAGIYSQFYADEYYTPYFEACEAAVDLYFHSDYSYGGQYVVRHISGNYIAKTLDEVIQLANIPQPELFDPAGKILYKFESWGESGDYVIGSERNAEGKIVKQLHFYAVYSSERKVTTITLNSGNSVFPDGTTTKTVTLDCDDTVVITSDMIPVDYDVAEGTYKFFDWRDERGVTYQVNGAAIGVTDRTYYARFWLDPEEFTLSISGRVATDEEDGTGNVYFNGDKSNTKLVVSASYGSTYALYNYTFAVDSKGYDYVAQYAEITVNGQTKSVSFVNNGQLVYIPVQGDSEVRLVFGAAQPKQARMHFNAQTCYAYDENGERYGDEIISTKLPNLLYYKTDYIDFYTSIAAPQLFYFDVNVSFVGWVQSETVEPVPPESIADKEIIYAGEQVFADETYKTYVAVFGYDVNAKFEIEFVANTDGQTIASEDGKVVYGVPAFGDGSVVYSVYGTQDEFVDFDKIPEREGFTFVGWQKYLDVSGTVYKTEEIRSMTYKEVDEMFEWYSPRFCAVYEETDGDMTVTLNAGNGTFDKGAAQYVANSVKKGSVATEITSAPQSNVQGLVFSYYADESGNPVSVVTDNCVLTAKYAKPVYTQDDLIAVNSDLNADYVLMNNITVRTGNWVPIGGSAGFNGTFNGNGYGVRFGDIIDADAFDYANRNERGMFGKLNGTVYNLIFESYCQKEHSADITTYGGFVREISGSGRLLDSQIVVADGRFAVNSTGSVTIGGVVAVNNGLIDGLTVSTGGNYVIYASGEVAIGSLAGVNNGVIRNVSHVSSYGGFTYVVFVKERSAYVGAFAGINTGTIEKSVTSSTPYVNLYNGDNSLAADSVKFGVVAGRNDGSINDVRTFEEAFKYYDVENVTMMGSVKKAEYEFMDEGNPYVMLREDGKETVIVYFGENPVKKGMSNEEYTLAEFAAAYTADAEKLMSLIEIVSADNVTHGDGEVFNTGIVTGVVSGELDAAVVAAGMDGYRFNYLAYIMDVYRDTVNN